MEVVMLYIYPYKIIFTLPAGLEGDSILETNKRTDAQSCSHKSHPAVLISKLNHSMLFKKNFT